MASSVPVVSFACSVFCLICLSRCQLQPYGKNVKSKYESYYVTELTSAKTQKSRRTCTQTCATKIIWCWKKKTVCKTLTYYEWKSVYKKVRKTRTVFYCMEGWAPIGVGCTKPLCPSGCGNGGSCIAPKTCLCAAGWTGSKCLTDVNECTEVGLNNCEYKPGCRNTQGSFTCSCSSGFYLMGDGRSCTDVNECTTGSHTCSPNNTCINYPGSYRCDCKIGFAVTPPRNVCLDIDECRASIGIDHGCQTKCNNNIGTYSCSCEKGYYLTSNGKDCSDNDECQSNVHGCEQQCLNLPGGYNCTCSSGYRLNAKDFKKCDDIDECSEYISGCAHDCKNTIGGYNCSCNRGYVLGKDSLSCNDIDECSNPVKYCQHICTNIPGSYVCTCRQGFYLNDDRKSCTGLPCSPIHTPASSIKNCTGDGTEDTCHFDCLPGYKLSGSKTRTCRPDKKWTGNDTNCKIIHCASPDEPPNGFVYSPCTTHYGSHCSLGCDPGHFAESTMISCDANGLWRPSYVSCRESKVCHQNPCRHGGKCSIVSEYEYSCDCTSTGYKGTNCDVGYFSISDYPTVITNVISLPIRISSSPPTEYVTLHVDSRDLQFSPSTLVFNRDTSLNQSVRVTAQETGYYFISYSITGPSAREFSLPEEDILFVESQENLEESSSIEESTSSFPFGCYKKQVGVCPGNISIVVSSTSPFVSFGPLSATEGIVALEVGNMTKMPLSLRGVNLPHPSQESLPDSCYDNGVFSYSTESLIKSRVLVKSCTDIISKSLPNWMNVTLSENSVVKKIHSTDLMTHFLTGAQLQDAAVGQGLPLIEDMLYSLLATKNLNLSILNDLNIFQSNALSVAVELCQESPSNIILQQSSETQIGGLKNTQIMRNLNEYGWNFNFNSIEFSKTNTIQRPTKGTFWDGQSFVNLGTSSGGNFAAVSSLEKNFQNSVFGDIRMKFDGTLIGDVEDIDQIINSPLHQQWNVDLYGRIALTIVFKMEGKLAKILVNGLESVGYASFGGDHHKVPGRKRGLFFTTILDNDPFIDTSLRDFVDMRTDSNFSCFVDTILYKEKNHFHHHEKTDSLSCAFSGILKVGLLKFSTDQLNLQMGEQSNSNTNFQNRFQLAGTFSESADLKFGIFERHSDSCTNIQFIIDQNTPGYTGSFCAICNTFGMKKTVNVNITRKDIVFQVRGKMYNQFDAIMNYSSRIAPWENQVFDVEGQFERSAGKFDFVTTLKQELEDYAKNSISHAMKRKEAVNQTAERARVRLEKILSLKNVALNELERLTDDYVLAKKRFAMAKRTLNSLEINARNYSEEVEKLKLDLNNLCNRKHCEEVCQEGIHCTTCYEYITENSKGMCPAICFRTEQRLIPPYSEIVHCDRQKCKRIHSTNGFFKTVFGEKIGGIVKDILSYAISGVATAFRAPPEIAAALGSGITTLLDTGRLDEAFCSASANFLLARIGGKLDKKFEHKKKWIPKAWTGVEVVVSKVVDCEREQKDGHWKCKVAQIECSKGRYEYQYEHIPYECKKSCVVETTTRTIEKSCCKNVTCASFVPNITCVVENVICKKARVDALDKISKLQAENVLKDLEYAKSNVSHWNIKMHERYSRLLRQQRWVNKTLNSARSLEKAYNSTIESKKEIEKRWAEPLKLMSRFNKQLTSADGMKLKEIRFRVKVYPGTDNRLLPIVVTLEANGTLHQISTVLDFEHLNRSLKSISEEILVDFSTNIFGTSRKKRSIDIPVNLQDTLLLSLKKYHSYCAKFTNYHEVLYNVAHSLYNLSSEHLFVRKALSRSVYSPLNITSLITSSKNVLNQTVASYFALEGNYSHVDNYKNDFEFSGAFELQQEEMRQNHELVNSTSKLLMYNWFASVEDIFNSSRVNYECTGTNDCIMHMLDELLQLFSLIAADGVDHIRRQVKNFGIHLDHISNSTNTTIEEGLKTASEMMNILEKMTKMKLVCAQSPNITKQPEPIIELGIGKVLVLNCKASGAALVYYWTFNGEILKDQQANVLTISNTTVYNSGNYTCIVSNKIAKAKSIPALVIIHPPPVIIEQPVEYLAAVLAEDESLQIEVEETGNNVSYQWWFKPAESSSVFAPLHNETFPYINFFPMKAKEEGWYFCQASSQYGETTSRISFVKALFFTLPVPIAVLSFSLDKGTEKINSSVQPSSFTDYDVFRSHIMKHILSERNFSGTVHVENLRPINCLSGKSKNESNGNVGICSWKFQYIGKNVTSNVTIDNDFKVNAGMVINATQEVSETMGRLVNATNNGSLSFSVAGNEYFAKRNSIAIHKYSLMCPRNQILLQQDLKCVDCPPGYHATLGKNGMTTCTPCATGLYQTEAGKTTCDSCPKGFTTWNKGSYKIAQCRVICQAGHYGRVIIKIGYCVPCPLNKYQPEEGQFECLPCPNNHVTKMEGATDLTQCMLEPTEKITEAKKKKTTESTTESTTEGTRDKSEAISIGSNVIVGLFVGPLLVAIYENTILSQF